jgi:RNA polymerase I-specific transcription initiation factor RRN7
VQSDLITRQTYDDEEAEDFEGSILRPGSRYRYYRSVEDLPDVARKFHDEAATLVGMSLENLVKAVFAAERKVSRWSREERKRERERVAKGKERA